jgi:hypothetical protein
MRIANQTHISTMTKEADDEHPPAPDHDIRRDMHPCMDDARHDEGPGENHRDKIDGIDLVERQADDIEQHRQFELVGNIARGRRAQLRIGGDREITRPRLPCLHRRDAADAHDVIDDQRQRDLRDDRPEYRGGLHWLIPFPLEEQQNPATAAMQATFITLRNEYNSRLCLPSQAFTETLTILTVKPAMVSLQ